MRTAGRAAAAAVFAAAILFLALPYWHAATMILRAAALPGALGAAARWDAQPVSDRIVPVTTRDGTLRVRVFQPARRAGKSVLLVSGVHSDGIDEPRLVNIARDLAATGVNVITPEIPDLIHYRLTPRVTDAIEEVGLWLAQQQQLSDSQPIGMIGVSFSGGLSVVAAGRPALRDRVGYVLSFGGHGNLPRVLRYYCTGIEPALPGKQPTQRPPHDYALAVLLHQAAELAVPSDQVGPLRKGIETFLQASALARRDNGGAVEMWEMGRKFQEEMPEPAAGWLKLVNNRDVSGLGRRLLPYLDRLGQDPALSPERSPAPAAPVYLLHGTGDNVIPAVESELLAEHLKGRTRVRTLISGFLTHVDLSTRPTLSDTWQMIAFWKAALGEL